MTFLGLRFPVLLLFFLAIPFLWFLWIGIYAISPGPPSATKQIEVVIPNSTSLSAIKKILAENKVIEDDPRFSMLVMLTGSAAKLRAGEYAFKPGNKPLEVIELLKNGKVLYRSVTIPEGTKLPEGQQDRDMIARELLIKFQMSPRHPLVELRKAYCKF